MKVYIEAQFQVALFDQEEGSVKKKKTKIFLPTAHKCEFNSVNSDLHFTQKEPLDSRWLYESQTQTVCYGCRTINSSDKVAIHC